MSNNFWGWGLEDDEFFQRLRLEKFFKFLKPRKKFKQIFLGLEIFFNF